MRDLNFKFHINDHNLISVIKFVILSVVFMGRKDFTMEIKNLAIRYGADLVGIADLKLLVGIFTYPPNLLYKYIFGISVAVCLDRYDNYDNSIADKAFTALETIASHVKEYIQSKGYKVQVNPPDRRVQDEGLLYWTKELSYKAVAKTAGLGWIGKSMLIVTPKFDPQVSLIIISIDIPLTPGKPIKNRYGKCRKCIEAWPVQTLIKVDFERFSKTYVLNVEQMWKLDR